MTALSSLWLPILASTVLVFIASSILHTVLPWHKHDFRPVPDQDKVMAALRSFGIPPGDYMMPRPSSSKDMASPEFAEKTKQGPVMVFTVMPSGMGMGSSLVKWFIYCAVVGLFAAYVVSRALPVGAEYRRVFQFVGVTAFCSYSLALWQATIWYRHSLTTTTKSTLDGLLYGLLTAGVFGWLWPR